MKRGLQGKGGSGVDSHVLLSNSGVLILSEKLISAALPADLGKNTKLCLDFREKERERILTRRWLILGRGWGGGGVLKYF